MVSMKFNHLFFLKTTKDGRVSILDTDVEGAAMLRLLERGPVSEGLRENPTADIPEETTYNPASPWILSSYYSSVYLIVKTLYKIGWINYREYTSCVRNNDFSK